MGDRPSWRDIDRKKDRSRHRQDERPAGPKPRVESATKAYRRQLDRLFAEGGLPEHLKDRLPAPEAEEAAPAGKGSDRLKRVRAVRQAPSGPELVKAIDALRKDYGLPDDLEILLRVLEHPSDAVLLEALALIEQHVEMGDPLPHRKTFVERLKGLELTSFDPRVQRKAATLAARLR